MTFPLDAFDMAKQAVPQAAAYLAWTLSLDGSTLIIRLNTEMPQEESRPIIKAIWAALKDHYSDCSYSPTQANVHVRDPQFPRPKPDFICTRGKS